MPILSYKHFSLGTVVYSIFILVLIAVIGTYVLFEARHVIDGPKITLKNEPAELARGATIVLSGSTENIVSLTLNGRTIYTNDGGDFQETVVLPTGYTRVTLTARDRYGRERTVERNYVRS